MDALSEMASQWKFRVVTSIRRLQELAHKWNVTWAMPLHYSQPRKTPSHLTTMSIPPSLGPTDFSMQQDDFRIIDGSFFDQQTIAYDNSWETTWDPTSYQTALEQVNMSMDVPDSWDLETLFTLPV